ncbi:hypothetical protein LOTGIDRAFT_131885 [Lottia gigantea]|uniref:Potassium channel domain-containing protein n=1 Tax=Lottia gigantea TaxID=225164 RepID=V3Z229_LOTGI|nr:hypothetical protein LOTGIDRAFT_131885 [Lottia gigantea]ESO84618.1 hypothetical protein LOTGIDRAFT_131885 [Lottia gigantea]
MALSKQTIERIHRVKVLIIKGIKKFLTFLLSHVGLTVAVAGYGIVGGMIFQHIEAPHEILLRQRAVVARERLNQKLLKLSEDVNITTNETLWMVEAEELLVKFQDEMFSLTNNEGWDGKEVEDELQWSFPGALLYAVTVITTIGYGHIAPKTGWGRIVTILYALFGIPLTLLCLRNIGTLLSSIVRLFYKYTCSSKSSSNEDQKEANEPAVEEQVRVPVTLTFLILIGYIIGGAIMFGLWEKEWDILIGSYFCFITLSTIGFGDFVPGTDADSWANHEKNIICSAYLLFGMAIMAMCFHLMQEEVRLKCRRLAHRIGLFKEELVKDIS